MGFQDHFETRSPAAMKVLVWQWGRFGAGPRYALEMAARA